MDSKEKQLDKPSHWVRLQVVKEGQIVLQTPPLSEKEFPMVQICLQVLHGLEAVKLIHIVGL